MLTPANKLHSGVNDIIQIVVTTACNLFTCSNCTQLLPFRRDYLHMKLECFEQAVISLEDWPGIVGIFGGNPCSHPRFPELCEILAAVIPMERRGLWTNDLMQHGLVARDTFYPSGRFNLNAHADTAAAMSFDRWLPGRVIPESRKAHASHAPILLHYRDFGITDEAWVEAREACDINQRWSAAIVERYGQPYAYFCEVAAALDGIRQENSGLPLTPRWWDLPMGAFQSQVHSCCDRGCGVPLKVQGHIDCAEVYDLSESFIPLANLTRHSNKVGLRAHTSLPQSIKETTDYMKVRP